MLDRQPGDAKPLTKQVAECLDTWNDFLHRSPASVEIPYYPLWTMEWGADYVFEDETPYAAYFHRSKRALARMKGSHGIKLGSFSRVDERFAALPSHARGHSFEFPAWKKVFIRSNRAFYADNRSWIEPWMNKVLRFPSSLQKFEWNAKGGERDIYRYVIQFRASGVRVKRPTRAPSLVAMTDTQVPIIGWERRYMTERECARLQSLHTLKALPASRPKAFAALGNAVNADVVERVARALFAGTGPASPSTTCQPIAHLPAAQPSVPGRKAKIADADPVKACWLHPKAAHRDASANATVVQGFIDVLNRDRRGVPAQQVDPERFVDRRANSPANVLYESVPAEVVLEEFIQRLSLSDGDDAFVRAGAVLALNKIMFDAVANTLVDVFVMGQAESQQRSRLAGSDSINQVFSGHAPNTTDRSKWTYGGDKEFVSEVRPTLHVRRFTLKADPARCLDEVRDAAWFALHIPAALRKRHLLQDS